MDPDGSIRGATDPVSGEDMINEYANIFPNVAVLCASVLISIFFLIFLMTFWVLYRLLYSFIYRRITDFRVLQFVIWVSIALFVNATICQWGVLPLAAHYAMSFAAKTVVLAP